MKIFLTIFFFISLLLSSKAQINNPLVNPRISSSADTLEVRAFRRLLTFISSDVRVFNKTEANKSLKQTGEQRFLYMPTHANPEVFPPEDNNSYDNFLPTVYNKEALEGSPFLLDYYAPGLVVTELDSIIDIPAYLYNYDKASGNFLLKRGNEAPIAVYKDHVKLFCLKTDKGGYIFERVPLINSNEYLQVLFKGSKYSFYKQIKSSFIPANQASDGYTRAGKDYDEYQDFYTYYLVDQIKDEFVVFELSKKSIRKSFPSETVIVEHYLKEHKWEPVDETFVEHLIDKVNK